MDYTLLAAWGFAILTFISLILFVAGLLYGLRQTAWEAKSKQRYLLISTVILPAWLSFTGLAAYNGLFTRFDLLPPPMIINLLLPIIFILWWIRQRSTHEILAGIPLYWLPAMQSFRIPVELLLWSMLIGGILPEQLTFEGYNFDVLSGVLGLILAFLLFRGVSKPIRWIRLYNLFGLVLLFIIVSMAILSMPTPFRQFLNEPSNAVMATFPFIWLPAFLVPLAFCLHLLSLRQTTRFT